MKDRVGSIQDVVEKNVTQGLRTAQRQKKRAVDRVGKVRDRLHRKQLPEELGSEDLIAPRPSERNPRYAGATGNVSVSNSQSNKVVQSFSTTIAYTSNDGCCSCEKEDKSMGGDNSLHEEKRYREERRRREEERRRLLDEERDREERRIQEEMRERDEAIQRWEDAIQGAGEAERRAKDAFKRCIECLRDAAEKIPVSVGQEYLTACRSLKSMSSHSFYSTIVEGRGFIATEPLDQLYHIQSELEQKKGSAMKQLEAFKSEIEAEKAAIFCHLREACRSRDEMNKSEGNSNRPEMCTPCEQKFETQTTAKASSSPTTTESAEHGVTSVDQPSNSNVVDVSSRQASTAIPVETVDIFISYATANRDIVEQIRHDIEQATTLTTWMDHRRIQGGDHWEREIEQNLRNCNTFIVAISEASNNSTWVQRETILAEQLGKKRIPILIENPSNTQGSEAPLPFRLLDLQYVDFSSKPYEEGFMSLLDVLNQQEPKTSDIVNDDLDIPATANTAIYVDPTFFPRYDTILEELRALRSVEASLKDSKNAYMRRQRQLKETEWLKDGCDIVETEERNRIDLVKSHWFYGTTALQPQLWFRGGTKGKIQRATAKLENARRNRTRFAENIVSIRAAIKPLTAEMEHFSNSKQQKDFLTDVAHQMRELAIAMNPSSRLVTFEKQVKSCEKVLEATKANSCRLKVAVECCESASDFYHKAESHWNESVEYSRFLSANSDPRVTY